MTTTTRRSPGTVRGRRDHRRRALLAWDHVPMLPTMAGAMLLHRDANSRLEPAVSV